MTDKQPEALRLAEKIYKWARDYSTTWDEDRMLTEAAAELRRLHEVNAELVEIFKRIRFEQGFACECGIEDATWELIETAITKSSGEQQ
jgi:hypothetical protein